METHEERGREVGKDPHPQAVLGVAKSVREGEQVRKGKELGERRRSAGGSALRSCCWWRRTSWPRASS